MKRILSLALCLVLCLTLLPAVPASAAGGVAIDETNFPDETFRSYVSYRFDTNGDGKLSSTEIGAAKQIGMDYDLDRSKVTSLKGIEYLTELTDLQIAYSQITELDLSKNTKLSWLDCSSCALPSLDFSSNTELRYLNCGADELTALDLSKNTELETLYIMYSGLTRLDLSNNAKLKTISVRYSGLTKLSLSKQTELSSLSCEGIALTKLDLSSNTKLTNLYLAGTELKSLDVSMCPALVENMHYNVNPSYLSGTYELAYWDYMTESVSSTITVDRDVQVYCDPKAVISAQPESLSAEEGDTVSFRVSAQGERLSYQWYYRKTADGAWYKCSDGTANTLTVTAKSYRNGFQYRCKLLNGRSAPTYTKPATLTVTPSQKPPVVSKQPKDVSTSSGATANFKVSSSNSDLTYQWYYRKTADGSWLKCSNGASATLSVEAVAYRDGYQYRCKLTNAFGSTWSEAATLYVDRLPIITVQPENTVVGMNKKTTISVAAQGEDLVYQWFYMDSDRGYWCKCTTSGNNTAILTVKGSENSQDRRYRCKITNAYGKAYSDTVTLEVVDKPSVDEYVYDCTVSVGETGSFEVYSMRAESFQWYYRKSETGSWIKCTGESATTATLFVEAKLYRNGYQYRCKVSNIAGSVYTLPATLYVEP